mmetsp:Transcript_10310/g.17676  ORF Transcript_10310/g.17676 Transcript_10310/m.17676 type:complete len:442 (+) Transcript_10310:1543-2868(+)
MPQPGKFIRYIYNRLILENATVRAAAVSALACFGSTNNEHLRRSVVVLLQQSLMDNDDEVCDCANVYVRSLGLDKVMKNMTQKTTLDTSPLLPFESLQKLSCPVQNLEAELLRYVASMDGSTAFDIGKVSKAAIHVAPPPGARKADKSEFGAAMEMNMGGQKTFEPAKTVDPAEKLCSSPGIKALGLVNRPFNSRLPPIDLTEEGTEYEVKCIKHVYANAVALEFIILNTLKDQVLENVTVEVDAGDVQGVSKISYVPAARIAYSNTESCYTVLFNSSPEEYVLGSMTCTLKYTMKEVDAASGDVDEDGYEDAYQVDDLSLVVADMIAAPAELPTNFKAAWDTLGDGAEIEDSFSLGAHETVAAAVKAVISFLGMVSCEGSDHIVDRAKQYVLLLAGLVVPNVQALVRAQFQLQPEGGVALNLLIRSESEQVSSLIASCIA